MKKHQTVDIGLRELVGVAVKIEPHKQDKQLLQQVKPGSSDKHGQIKSDLHTATYEDLSLAGPVYENIVS